MVEKGVYELYTKIALVMHTNYILQLWISDHFYGTWQPE